MYRLRSTNVSPIIGTHVEYGMFECIEMAKAEARHIAYLFRRQRGHTARSPKNKRLTIEWITK